MARTRGHTRKRKTRLTNQTFSAVMDLGRRADPAAVEAAVETVETVETVDAAAEPTPVESVEFNILDLLRAEPETVSIPAAYNEPGSIFRDANGFATDSYLLGLVLCPECHNEMMYYQRREALVAGYHFRCWVCQHELLAALD